MHVSRTEIVIMLVPVMVMGVPVPVVMLMIVAEQKCAGDVDRQAKDSDQMASP
jgi:hypothetical protein